MARSQFILEVPALAQKGTSLCWAAAMQIAINAIDPNRQIKQGELSALQFRIWSHRKLSRSEINECDGIGIADFGTFYEATSGKRWNQDLVNEENTQPFDTLFSLAGYYSIHDQRPDNTADWSNLTPGFIQKQLTISPIILTLSEVDENENDMYPSTHAVVVSGIWRDKDDQYYLYVSDPLSSTNTEKGSIYSIHFQNLISSKLSLRIKTLTMEIRKKMYDYPPDFSETSPSVVDFDTLGATVVESLKALELMQVTAR